MDKEAVDVPRELGASVYPLPSESPDRAGVIFSALPASNASLKSCAWLRRRRGRRHREAVPPLPLPAVALALGGARAALPEVSPSSMLWEKNLDRVIGALVSFNTQNWLLM